jgi:hypothetical protein
MVDPPPLGAGNVILYTLLSLIWLTLKFDGYSGIRTAAAVKT